MGSKDSRGEGRMRAWGQRRAERKRLKRQRRLEGQARPPDSREDVRGASVTASVAGERPVDLGQGTACSSSSVALAKRRTRRSRYCAAMTGSPSSIASSNAGRNTAA
jgi:hypothetical protein